MLKKLLLWVGMLSILATSGCMTTEPTIYSWHEFHVDFDRVLFDMEEYPRELDY